VELLRPFTFFKNAFCVENKEHGSFYFSIMVQQDNRNWLTFQVFKVSTFWIKFLFWKQTKDVTTVNMYGLSITVHNFTKHYWR
jgi:hypothetical protein